MTPIRSRSACLRILALALISGSLSFTSEPIFAFSTPSGVSSASLAGFSTVLTVGQPYRLIVTGTYLSNDLPATIISDAECSLGADGQWLPNRFIASDPTGDLLDLYVNGSAVTWAPLVPAPLVQACSFDASHTYGFSFTPQGAASTTTVTFMIKDEDSDPSDNSGDLYLKIACEGDWPAGLYQRQAAINDPANEMASATSTSSSSICPNAQVYSASSFKGAQ